MPVMTGKSRSEIDANTAKIAVEFEIAKLSRELLDTDWYVVRATETGIPVPPDILVARAEARDRISALFNVIKSTLNRG